MKTMAVISAFLGCSLGSVLARACECPSQPLPMEAMTAATAVMEVYVLYKGDTVDDVTSYEVDVNKVWKGEPRKDSVITTRAIDGVCNGDLEIKKNYLVYANGEKLEVDACSRTFDPKTHKARLSFDEDLKAFKK